MSNSRTYAAGGRANSVHRAGLSLVETLVASAVLAVGVAAVSEAVVSAHMQTRESLVSVRGDELAGALMQEVISKAYRDPQGTTTWGPDAGETGRALYDNIDDYHNYTDGPTNLSDASASAYPADFQGYTRSVAVTASTLTVSGLPQAVTGVNVTVTVTRRGRTWTLSRFVADPGESSSS